MAGHEQLNGFKAAFTAGGGRIAGEQYSPFGITQDFQPYLAQVRASGAGAIYAFYAGQDAIGFVRQYRDFGLTGRIPLYGPGLPDRGADARRPRARRPTGIITALHYSSELDTPVNRDFVEAYEAAYKALADRPSRSRPTTPAPSSTPPSPRSTGPSPARPSSPRCPRSVRSTAPGGPWRFSPRRNPDQRMYLRQVRRDGDRFVNAVVGRTSVGRPGR